MLGDSWRYCSLRMTAVLPWLHWEEQEASLVMRLDALLLSVPNDQSIFEGDEEGIRRSGHRCLNLLGKTQHT